MRAKVSDLDDPDGSPVPEHDNVSSKRARPESSGIHELDSRDFAEPYATIGNISMYLLDAPFRFTKPGTKTMDDFYKLMQEANSTNAPCKARNLALVYTNDDLTVDAVYDAISSRVGKAALCVGSIQGGILAYIKRENYTKYVQSVSTVSGTVVEPTTYAFKRGGRPHIALMTINDVLTDPKLNFQLKVIEDINVDRIMNHLLDMNDVDVIRMKADFELKAPDQRTEFERSFLRGFFSIMKIREEKAKRNHMLVFDAATPPSSMYIPPLSDLINLDQKGITLEAVTGLKKTFTLMDVLTNSNIMATHTIVLLGANNTTGYGKTSLALRLASQWTRAMAIANKKDASTAKIVLSADIDSVRTVRFSPGMTWVLDEFSPADRDQVQFMSSDMMKVLMSTTIQGTLRSRYENVSLPPGLARVITGNSASPEEWTGKRVPWAAPLQRKSLVFVITKPLLRAEARQQLADKASSEVLTEATAFMQRELADALPAEEEASASRFVCPRRS